MAGTLWFEHNGQQWHVDAGSPAHDRLVTDGAVEIDAPDEAKSRTRKPADKGDEA